MLNENKIMKIELRYAAHPDRCKNLGHIPASGKNFLLKIFSLPDDISLVYSLYDRYIVGGAMPVKNKLLLETTDELKSENFLDEGKWESLILGGKL